jgi:hypothetical protein
VVEEVRPLCVATSICSDKVAIFHNWSFNTILNFSGLRSSLICSRSKCSKASRERDVFLAERCQVCMSNTQRSKDATCLLLVKIDDLGPFRLMNQEVCNQGFVAAAKVNWTRLIGEDFLWHSRFHHRWRLKQRMKAELKSRDSFAIPNASVPHGDSARVFPSR